MSIIKEFKEFAIKGNAIDLAVGIVIGSAFATIVKSLVDDIILPPIGLLVGNVDFSNLFVVLKDGTKIAGPYVSIAAAKQAGAVTLNFGLFINSMVNFTIVAFAIFMLVKTVNRMKRKPEAEATPAANKTCKFCCSTISDGATRCPHCTSDL